MKTFQKKLLSASASTALTLTICSAIPMSQASDISIYSDSTKGKTGILLMLDTSGSMGISSLVLPRNNKFGSPGDVDSSLCEKDEVLENRNASTNTVSFQQWKYNATPAGSAKTTFPRTVTINGKTITYYLRGCRAANSTTPYIDDSGKLIEDDKGKFDRLSRMKHAMIQLLSDQSIDNNVRIGLAHFSSKTDIKIGGTGDKSALVDGHSAKILVPVDELSLEQREKLIKELAGIKSVDTRTDEDGSSNNNLRLSSKNSPGLFRASSGTPTAHAYAEAGAYMMGTSTGSLTPPSSIGVLYDGYAVIQKNNSTDQVYYVCVALNGATDTPWSGTTSMLCDNEWNKTDANWWDSTNKRMAYQTKIFKPDGLGGWIPVTAEQLQEYLNSLYPNQPNYGNMNSLWETHEKLPVGWRYGGWMKVQDEPMDIEPIGGVVWTNKGSNNLVSYRSSPFSLVSGNVTGRKLTQQNCPTGYSLVTSGHGQNVICQKTLSNAVTRPATELEQQQQTCRTSVIGDDPIRNVYIAIGAATSDAFRNNKLNTTYVASTKQCRQTIEFIARPWTETTQTVNGPVDNMVGGFAYSVKAAKTPDLTKYQMGGSTSQCDGNGIYFLTDGAPNSTKDPMAKAIMNLSLAESKYQFLNKPTANTLVSPGLQASVFEGETGGWEYIGAYAKKLRDKTQNPGNMAIKTAVVGFGSSFEDLKETKDCEALIRVNPNGYNKDAYNACKWGSDEYGDGGFYYAENTDDIRNSILDFVRKVEVDIKPVATGTPTIPVDALNPTTLQNDAYYASFQPTVSSVSQIWMGNLNKYRIKNGELFSADGSQRLISSTGALNDAAQGFWMGGVLGQLKVGADFLADGKTTTHRKIFTNRTITDSTASASKDLQVVDVDALFDGAFAGDSDKLYWLNALGYKLNEVPTNFTKANLSTYATDKRLGAVMHSTPVLLTQEGQVSVLTNTLVTTNRKDYLMYGSTQGVLHVVDVSTGQEVFGFLPHEMMVNQKQALLLNDKTTGGMSNLFYGIDAPWVAHTQYTTKNNGLLTVKESDRTETDEEDSEAFLKGHQWVYGGLRMGGKSYYALNLTDINNPKMMFHIDPSTSASEPLQRMGESWSKPTLAYVNWGGEKKLVMFVGGGYDREGNVECTDDTTATNKGYECPTYKQTNKIGAGVYMFDAQNGDLLWWTSADDNGTTDTKIRFTANTDLQYSVVSQINAIDRNADGLVDHLYFGDLAGQAFRVDLNNTPEINQPNETDPEKLKEAIKEAKKNAFATRTVTLFTEHSTDGLSPRFYEMPSVSVHTDTDTGALFAAAAFSSGNRSAPLADSTQSANDGVFVVYDNDVVAKGLYAANYTLATTKENKLQALAIGDAVSRKTNSTFNAGWKHSFSSTAGSYKGMNDIYALDGMLYVNVFHKDGAGISGSCGGGVKGDSYLYQYCLPYGKCDFYTAGTTSPNRVKLGAGILGTGIGQGYNNKISTLGLIVNRDNPSPTDCSLLANKNLPQCQLFDNAVKLKQLRWYESH